MEITKESIIAEVELAFELYEKIKPLSHDAKYRVVNIMERLWSDARMKEEMAEKSAYHGGSTLPGPRLVP